MRNVEVALSEAGAGVWEVVRPRIYVTNIEGREKVGRSHGEFFGEFTPPPAWLRWAGSSRPRSRRDRSPRRQRNESVLEDR